MGDAPVHVTVWNDSTHAASAENRRVVLVHGTMTWGEECFARQRPLAGEFELVVMDRRGFGDSPDTERSDWEADAEDVIDLLGAGAHLVGHSYGGVVAMAAAARRPDAIRSLVLIEPAALRVAETASARGWSKSPQRTTLRTRTTRRPSTRCCGKPGGPRSSAPPAGREFG